MSKILTRTVKKTSLLATVLTFILLVAVALGIVFGVKGYGVFNKNATLDDANTLTVSMNQHVYITALDKVEDACEAVFGDLDVAYELNGEMTGDESEIVYVFASDVDLSAVETALETKIAELVKNEPALDGAFITVAVNSENTVEVLADNYVLRGVIAGLVMAVLVYIYAAIRFGIGKGVLAAIGTFYSMALTAAVVILVRVPVTTSISYVLGTAGLLGAVIAMLSLNKIKATEKAEGASELSAEEVVVSSVATKEVAPIVLVSVGALAVLAILAPVSVKWFALSAAIGVVMAAVAGLLLVPSLYIPVKKAADKKPKPGYVGAQKTSTKVKKTFVKAAAPVAVKEEPVEPVAPVEEAPVEEAVEELPAEEVAEEVPVEEETVEEVSVEEAPAEEAPANEEQE